MRKSVFLGVLALCWTLNPSFSYGQNAEPKTQAKGAPTDASAALSAAYTKVPLESFATQGSKPVAITGYLLKSESAGKAPAAVLHPACEGLMSPDGSQIKIKYTRMGRILHEQGFTVLMVDGFNPRGFADGCMNNDLDPITRLKDILGGLAYLRTLDDVAGDKVVMVTWGAAGSLQGMNKTTPYYEKLGTGFAGAVMFYPECAGVRERFAPYAPIQAFIGEKDAWNPPAPCRALARRQESGTAPFAIKTYPDTYHAFDAPVPPRMSAPLPRIGSVMVGGNPQSAADAYATTKQFLADLIK